MKMTEKQIANSLAKFQKNKKMVMIKGTKINGETIERPGFISEVRKAANGNEIVHILDVLHKGPRTFHVSRLLSVVEA